MTSKRHSYDVDEDTATLLYRMSFNSDLSMSEIVRSSVTVMNALAKAVKSSEGSDYRSALRKIVGNTGDGQDVEFTQDDVDALMKMLNQISGKREGGL